MTPNFGNATDGYEATENLVCHWAARCHSLPMSQTILTIPTYGPGLTEITGDVQSFVSALASGAGLITLFIKHTSCSLLIQENADPDVQADLLAYLQRLVPNADHKTMRYLTHTLEGVDDMPAHIKAALLPVSLSVPVTHGRLALGTWQGIYLFEHRNQPHSRHIVLHYCGD